MYEIHPSHAISSACVMETEFYLSVFPISGILSKAKIQFQLW